MHGWVSLPTSGEVYVEQGLPRRVWVADGARADVERLAREVAAMVGVHVLLGAWEPSEDAEGMEAALHVIAADIGLVLGRLARSSAETFVDRYQKPIDSEDTDYDDEAYAQDMETALALCGLHWSDVDAQALRQDYRLALHRASEEIVAHPV
jgi:hypothetical protein